MLLRARSVGRDLRRGIRAGRFVASLFVASSSVGVFAGRFFLGLFAPGGCLRPARCLFGLRQRLRSFRLRRRLAGAVVDAENRLADLHLVAGLDLDLFHLPARPTMALRSSPCRFRARGPADPSRSCRPGFTSTRSTSPAAMFSPSSGRVKSVGTRTLSIEEISATEDAEDAEEQSRIRTGSNLRVPGVLRGEGYYAVASRDRRIDLLGIDVVRLHRLLHDAPASTLPSRASAASVATMT